jgi:hypothetical protein
MTIIDNPNEYFAMAKEGTLPADFDQWDLTFNPNLPRPRGTNMYENQLAIFEYSATASCGTTVAHIAARNGHLPKDFNRWEIADKRGTTIAHEVIRQTKKVPKGLTCWEMADETGWTVAHEVAFSAKLPRSFTRWDLADNTGWTVAHAVAEQRAMPKRFNQWALADQDGCTVAHIAAWHDRLPPDFDQWDLENNDGKTVRQTLKGAY